MFEIPEYTTLARQMNETLPGKTSQRHDLYTAIIDTTQAVIELGDRNDEIDLFGKPGGYVRHMDSHRAGRPCHECGGMV